MTSKFQQTVYDAVRKIPKGNVTTYKLVGQMIGCESFRAIGQALKVNPYAPDVPCHRVIKSDLTIGGFRGKNIIEKMKLLEKEGIFFKKNKLKDPTCVWSRKNNT